jgi:hypothetical protein
VPERPAGVGKQFQVSGFLFQVSRMTRNAKLETGNSKLILARSRIRGPWNLSGVFGKVSAKSQKLRAGTDLSVLSKFCGQATKGAWWMPWQKQAKKDVASCDKPRGAASRH